MDSDPRYLESVAASYQGRRRTMQSAVVANIVPGVPRTATRRRVEPTGAFAVFDGSANGVAAAHCHKALVPTLTADEAFHSDLEVALTRTTTNLHETLQAVADTTRAPATCAASVVLVRDGHVYCVNAASDRAPTRSMICRADGDMQWLDGEVTDSASVTSSFGSRMSECSDDRQRSTHLGSANRIRADINVLGLDYEDEFILMGSRGFWSTIRPSVAAKILKSTLRRAPNLATAVQKLVYAAYVNGARDNIIVQVVLLSSAVFSTPTPSPSVASRAFSAFRRTRSIRHPAETPPPPPRRRSSTEHAGASPVAFIKSHNNALAGPAAAGVRVTATAGVGALPKVPEGAAARSRRNSVEARTTTRTLPSSSTVTAVGHDGEEEEAWPGARMGGLGEYEEGRNDGGAPGDGVVVVGGFQMSPLTPTRSSSSTVDYQSSPLYRTTDWRACRRLDYAELKRASGFDEPSDDAESTETRPSRPASGDRPEVQLREQAFLSLTVDELAILMEAKVSMYQFEEAARIRNIIARKQGARS